MSCCLEKTSSCPLMCMKIIHNWNELHPSLPSPTPDSHSYFAEVAHITAICVHCNHLKVTTDYWLPFDDTEVYLIWFMSWFIEEQRASRTKPFHIQALWWAKVSFCAKKVAKLCSVMCFLSVWVCMHAHSELTVVLVWEWVMSLVPWQGKECTVCVLSDRRVGAEAGDPG